MSDLTLFYAPGFRAMIVHWLLEELGVPFRLRVLDIAAREHKQAEYLRVNPMGRVPALLHGDVVVTETAAICAYLAEAFPDAGLHVPPGDPARGSFLRWMFFMSVSAEPTVMWATLGIGEDSVRFVPFATVEEVADTLCDALGGGPFILGDRFTAADVMAGAGLMYGLDVLRVLPRRPALVSYWDRLRPRPALVRARARDEAIRSGELRPTDGFIEA